MPLPGRRPTPSAPDRHSRYNLSPRIEEIRLGVESLPEREDEVTDQGAFAGTRPITWPRAAIGAALVFGLMVVLVVVVPSLFVTSDPSTFTKFITIAYVVVLFAIAAGIGAAWQYRGQAPHQPLSQRVSAFGRPMRDGPGFASFAGRDAPGQHSQPNHMKSVGTEPIEGVSSFGRPVEKRSR